MNFDHFPVDLVLLALLAIFIALRLRSTLGKRSESPASYPTVKVAQKEKKRPDVTKKVEPSKEVNLDIPAQGTRVGKILEVLHQKEPAFTPHNFLKQVQVVFGKVLDAYAKGNEEILKTLLTPSVCQAFVERIQKRKEEQEVQKCDIKDLRSLAIEDAQIKNSGEHSLANVSVRILSDQVNMTSDKEGDVVDGVDAVVEFSDLWVFERILGVPGMGWRLAGTRSA